MRGVRALIRRDACQPSHHHHHHRALATVAASAASTTSTSTTTTTSSSSTSSSSSSSSSPFSVLRHHHSTKAAPAHVAAGGEGGGEGGSASSNQRQGTRTGVRPKGAPFRGTRGDNGRGWYKLYKEEGPEGFVKYRPPTPFDWSKPPTSSSTSSSPTSSAVPKRKKVFLDISLDKEPLGKIVIELANDLLPLTSENFLLLCQGLGREGGSAAALGYKGSKIHRIVKGAGIVGGDLSTSTSSSLPASSEKPRRKERGEGNHSALGARFFHDEGFVIPHSAPGLVSMVSAGVHRNGSHFYISTEACPHLDGRSVVFGRVVGGMEVVEKVAGTYSIRGRPVASVRVEEAGVVEE